MLVETGTIASRLRVFWYLLYLITSDWCALNTVTDMVMLLCCDFTARLQKSVGETASYLC